jgi:hypothetical protein
MVRSASFIQYMRAHGNTPGPTQRPVLAGAVTGALAEIPAVLLLWWSGAFASASQSLSLSLYGTFPLLLLIMVITGVIYGRVFSRAANDPRGGWLFGISFGFLIWMIGPVTFLQWWCQCPLALEVAAMGILGAHLVYGLFLGLLFPWIHKLLQGDVTQLKGPGRHGRFGVKSHKALLQSRGK